MSQDGVPTAVNFNGRVQTWIKTGTVSYEFNEIAWDAWYEKYITKGKAIDDNAIKEFLYFMIEDWDDDWYDHTSNYDFDRTTEINLQP